MALAKYLGVWAKKKLELIKSHRMVFIKIMKIIYKNFKNYHQWVGYQQFGIIYNFLIV